MEYELKRSLRARTMRLAVHPDARVVVTAPPFFEHGAIEQFVAEHSAWISKHVERVRGRTVIRIRRNEISELKKRALAFASARSLHFGAMYAFTFRKISIRAQKSRWGSCSRAGNLSFNYKIAALPALIADYIIIHELCHLAHLDHSKEFWTLVEHAAPNYKDIRKKLRNMAFIFC
ncbi:MAG: SprT family zinc-dependent metalloprotease [Patescibacteria group bacterium]